MTTASSAKKFDATSPQRAHAAAYIYDRENSYVDLAEQTQKSTYSNYAFSSVLDGRTDNSSTFPSTPLTSSSMQNIIRRISRLFMPLRRGQVLAPEFTLIGSSPSMTSMDARGSIPIREHHLQRERCRRCRQSSPYDMAASDLFALKVITKGHVLVHQELQHTLTEQPVMRNRDPIVIL